jgi:predicted MPP superfamily phosphohydrolase
VAGIDLLCSEDAICLRPTFAGTGEYKFVRDGPARPGTARHGHGKAQHIIVRAGYGTLPLPCRVVLARELNCWPKLGTKEA